MSCSGIGGNTEQCKASCSSAGQDAAAAGCTAAFAEFVGCLVSSDVCNGDAVCWTESQAYTACITAPREPAPTPDDPEPLPAARCSDYCEATITEGCGDPSLGDCEAQCGDIYAIAARMGPDCRAATDAVIACVLDKTTSVCVIDTVACEEEINLYVARCPG